MQHRNRSIGAWTSKSFVTALGCPFSSFPIRPDLPKPWQCSREHCACARRVLCLHALARSKGWRHVRRRSACGGGGTDYLLEAVCGSCFAWSTHGAFEGRARHLGARARSVQEDLACAALSSSWHLSNGPSAGRVCVALVGRDDAEVRLVGGERRRDFGGGFRELGGPMASRVARAWRVSQLGVMFVFPSLILPPTRQCTGSQMQTLRSSRRRRGGFLGAQVAQSMLSSSSESPAWRAQAFVEASQEGVWWKEAKDLDESRALGSALVL